MVLSLSAYSLGIKKMAQGGEEQKTHFKDSGMYNRALEIQN